MSTGTNVCLYLPAGRLLEGYNLSLLTRKRTDGEPFVSSVVFDTTNPLTIEGLKRLRPDIKPGAASNLGFAKCRTRSLGHNVWYRDAQPWLHLSPDRQCTPDSAMSAVYEYQFAGHGWDHYWFDADGRAISPQPNSVPADPFRKWNVAGPDDERQFWEPPITTWGKQYQRFCGEGKTFAFAALDMTVGVIGWEPFTHYLSDVLWWDGFRGFVRSMNMTQTPLMLNTYGGSSRSSYDAAAYHLERWGNQAGYNPWGLWKYVTRWEANGALSGITTMTEAQRKASVLDVMPKPNDSREYVIRQLTVGLAVCALFDIGSIAMNRTWDCKEWRGADVLSVDELERWLTLKPVGPLMGGGETFRKSEFWDSSFVQASAGEMVGVGDYTFSRLFVAPGGQKWKVLLNPNRTFRAGTEPESARMMMVN